MEGIVFVCVVVVEAAEGVEDDGKFAAGVVFWLLRFLGAMLCNF